MLKMELTLVAVKLLVQRFLYRGWIEVSAQYYVVIKPVSNDKTEHFSEMKAITDYVKRCLTWMKLFIKRIENIVRKDENAHKLHFLLFPQCFQYFS